MSASKIIETPLYSVEQPEWSKCAVIYQVNTRQFSKAGNFKGVEQGLDHIKSLGVDIIWLMPVHPIGEVNRKGRLGSPYAVKDYHAINAEFGSEDDLLSLVRHAHILGLKVILDWVPNHSAWDNYLVKTHPQWYAKDHHGNFRPSPWWDWDDIIEFDYAQQSLRDYMIEAMCYWVERFDVDGFRCDVAGYVPKDFWEQARLKLDTIKPVFLLAEWESRDLHEKAFNMTYAWSWNETVHGIARQGWPLDKLRKYYSWNERAWPKNAYRMTFVSNHDKNAWEGTQREQFGHVLEAAIILSVLGEGVPLIYNGQEAGESKRLAFFERDPIEWQEHAIGDLYRRLIKWKHKVSALWNGAYGATMIQIPNTQMDSVFSFIRAQNNERVLVIINFSKVRVNVKLKDAFCEGDYVNMLSSTRHTVDTRQSFSLAAGEPLALFSEDLKEA
ncbi:alpha-amylase family glycosyl hydrolase [Alteromonas sp. ASW11-130]|uniref:alpha-amylase family glycosyl hydrolase n=1 Tax=Alteromonas sp. ASW11-130 TaxID=3015775 RepID=UPI0022421325|nr:alpha-amylase family glycosyl hydrolase [Alteromonas sp. ASW11-130]MCW8092540.1 alpha-amylase family glycosyl hydrolase [Alteromonas sp. ASW11-130]